MKGLPLPFDFEGKGVLDLDLLVKNKAFFTHSTTSTTTEAAAAAFSSSPLLKKNCFLNSFGEPTSVLDSARFSTSCSSLGGGGGGGSSDTAGVAAVSDTNPSPSSNVVGEKCGAAMEDWDTVLSESEQWIMGNSSITNKLIQLGGSAEFGFNGGGFGVFGEEQDQFGVGNFISPTNFTNTHRSSTMYPTLTSNNPAVSSIDFQFQTTAFDPCPEIKPPPPNFNPQMLINQHQVQNPSFFVPPSYAQPQQQELSSLFLPPAAKRHNPGRQISSRGSFSDMGRQQVLPNYLQQRPIEPGQNPKTSIGDDLGHCHQQQNQAIIDHLHKAAEMVQTGNTVLAQEILARLNHQLSPIGKPFHRAAIYFKEALEMLIHSNTNSSNSSSSSLNPSTSPFSLIFKIGAYKSFSEVSPLVQFANFTCTQTLLEAFEGFDRIHIVDFDIGYGGQWASVMQELALRSGGAPSLKITVLASPATHDHLELSIARENLIQFASEVNIAFEFSVMNVDYVDSGSCSLPFHLSENEVVGVNLPVGSLTTSVFRFLKQLSPRIVVSIDRGCDRADLPFANHIIHALQSYSNLLESLDVVNMNMDALQKIERFFLQPGIEKIVMGRFRSPEKAHHWRTMFLSSGFSAVTFSNFTESQADCVVKRTPVGGFQVEKRQSSLVLCWQRKELISVSAWRC